MAQGPPSKSKSRSSSITTAKARSKRTKDGGVQKPKLKKGARVIAPRKKKLVEGRKVAKKFSAGLISKTEQMLGERAGHLELLNGGKGKNERRLDEKGGKKGGREVK
ncbi:MAG: hypothetical protein Q9167_002286 [Letrouitia subvulpina]